MRSVAHDCSRKEKATPLWVAVGLVAMLAIVTSGAATASAPGVRRTPDPGAMGAGLSSTYQVPVGYEHVIDAYMNTDTGYADNNYGEDHDMGLRYDGRMRPLIRFDLAVIPPGANIVQATLNLYLLPRTWDFADQNLEAKVYRLNRAWVESEVTARRALAGSDWSILGADGVPSDREANPVTTRILQPSDRNRYVGLDVTSAVQAWVNDPGSNHGLLIKGATVGGQRGGFVFASSENPNTSYRPYLHVIYEGAPPVHTPTPTHTPTRTPTPSNLNVILSSVSPDCIGAGPYAVQFGRPNQTQVFLYWQGQAWSATLIMTVASVQTGCQHRVYVNDQFIGSPTPEGGEACQDRVVQELSFDASFVTPGWNTIRIEKDEGCWDNEWTAKKIQIRLAGDIVAPLIEDVQYGVRNEVPLKAKVQRPIGYSPDVRVPLLIVLHAWANDTAGAAASALYHRSIAASERGWLLAAPQMTGGRTASLERQADIINLVDYMVSNYAVDSRRIYLLGKSMGGANAAVIAAKYPDRFAAIVAEQGPVDLAEWYKYCNVPGQQRKQYADALYAEIGGAPYNGDYPTAYLFEYQRRSAYQMVQNLKHVPLLIIHGTADVIVPVNFSRQFYDALRFHSTDEAEYHEYDGEHGSDFPGDATLAPSPQGLLDFLGRHVLREEPPHDLHIRNDERAKAYYWLTIEQRKRRQEVFYPADSHWTDVQARYDPNNAHIWVDIFDEINIPWQMGQYNYQVRLTFDLHRMGLDPGAAYTVEVYEDEDGDYSHSVVTPVNGRLLVTVEGEADPRHWHVMITSSSAPEPTVRELQQGINGYWGTTDTYLYKWQPSQNYGNEPRMAVDGGSKVALLKFDLQGLPSHIMVHAAYLYLTSGWGSGGSDVSLYRVRRPWNEGEASWNDARRYDPWTSPGGCTDTVNDRVGIAADTRRVSVPYTHYRFNVRNLIQYWMDHPDENHGVLLKGSGTGAYEYFTSEYGDVLANRPKLEIRYVVGTPSPTPTASATQTATATPSPTLSATPTPTHTATATETALYTPTASLTGTATPTATPTATATNTSTPTATPTVDRASIYGLAFEDLNNNRQPDPGEPPLPGIEILIGYYGQEIARRQTGLDGRFRLDGLAGGQYFVRAFLKEGYVATDSLGRVNYIPPDWEVNFGMLPVASATPSVSPVPTDTFAPSPTPTVSPTMTATATATPDATPTATRTVKSTETPTATPTKSYHIYLPLIRIDMIVGPIPHRMGR